MFFKEWKRANHVYLNDGKVYKTSDNVAWINVVDGRDKQIKNSLARELFPGSFCNEQGEFQPPTSA